MKSVVLFVSSLIRYFTQSSKYISSNFLKMFWVLRRSIFNVLNNNNNCSNSNASGNSTSAGKNFGIFCSSLIVNLSRGALQNIMNILQIMIKNARISS